MHHIVSDGWSMEILTKEFLELYTHSKEADKNSLSELPLRYSDYSIWQRNYLKGEEKKLQLNYWKNKLNNLEELNLPYDYSPDKNTTNKGAVEKIELSDEFYASLKKLAYQNNTTPFVILLSALNLLLYRYTQQTDIAVGTPIANRNKKETENIIGFFVNTLVLRNSFSPEITFKKLIEEVKKTSIEAFANQDLPYMLLVEEMQKIKKTNQNSLFQIMFVFNSRKMKSFSLNGINIEPFDLKTETSKFDLSVSVSELLNGGIEISFEYKTDLFNSDSVKRYIQHYKNIITQIISDDNKKLYEYYFLSEADEDILSKLNKTEYDYDKSKNLISIFEEQVKASPDKLAVADENAKLTFVELNKKANKIAWHLRTKGIEHEETVAVCFNRTVEYLISVFAVLKAGGVFLPMDPNFPESRIEYMLENSGVKNILIR